MSKIEDWSKTIDGLKLTQEERDTLLKVEGVLEMAQKTETHPLAQMLATAFIALVRHIRTNETVHTWILNIFSTLISQQEQEIETMRSIIVSLASENKELLKKIQKRIEEMDEWRRQREPMLREIDDVVQQRKNFLDQNK